MYLALKDLEKDKENDLTKRKDSVKNDKRIMKEQTEKGISGVDIAFWMQMKQNQFKKDPSA